MKRRHRSTIPKRSVTVVHATIGLSNGIRTTNNKSLEHHKSLPSVTVSRRSSHNRHKPKKASIVLAIGENSNRTTNSISINRTQKCNGILSETQWKTSKKIELLKGTLEPSTNQTTFTKQKRKSYEEHTQEIIPTDEQLSSKSDKLSHYHDVSNNNMGQKNVRMNTYSISEHYQTKEEKYKRRRTKGVYSYCSCCSHLCAIASLFAGLLFGIAIAAAIVALVTTSKTTTSTVTADISTTSLTTSTAVSTTFPVLSVSLNDTVYGIWNTTAGGDSTLATSGMGVGNYVPAQEPYNAFDNNCSTKYTSFGSCIYSPTLISLTCGLNTGFYLIPGKGATIIKALRFCTGDDFPERDPLTMTLEGSNQIGSALMLGSSWSLIYNGSTGLDVDPNRTSFGVTETFSNNFIAYLSYRMLVTSKRGNDSAIQYSEVQLFGS